jgi:hypothetical protein
MMRLDRPLADRAQPCRRANAKWNMLVADRISAAFGGKA